MKPHENWIKKAQNDLKSARKLISGDDPILDTAVYHTQQCAEKSLKAYLTYQQIPFAKTHDLRVLNEIAAEKDQTFIDIMKYSIILNPYATAFRYPDMPFEPEIIDVKEAIDAALNIYEFVVSKIDQGLFDK